MKYIWYEKYIGVTCLYFGTMQSFKVGIVLGRENFVNLGFICFGIDLW
jgi:hypothetical protein